MSHETQVAIAVVVLVVNGGHDRDGLDRAVAAAAQLIAPHVPVNTFSISCINGCVSPAF